MHDPLAIFKMGLGSRMPITMIAHAYTASGSSFATSVLFFQADGNLLNAQVGNISTDVSPAIGADEWHVDNPSATGADFEVFVTVTAGDTPLTGLFDTWLGLGIQRIFGHNSETSSKNSTVTVRFRRTGTTKVIREVTGVTLAVTI